MDSTKVQPAPETKLHFLDYWRIIRIRKTIILAVFLLVVITAAVVTFMLPEQYASTVAIRIQRDQSDITGMTAGNQMPMGLDPYFIATEFEVIQSEVILGKVIEDLNLKNQWAVKNNGQPLTTTEAMGILKRRMDLRTLRNTAIVQITCEDESKSEAARIANAVAAAYRNYRLEQRRQRSRGGIEALKEYVEQQDQKVQEAQRQVDDLREKLKIPDMMAAGDSVPVLMSAETLRRFEQLRIEAETEYEKQKALLDELKRFSQEELIQVLPSSSQDVLLTSYLEGLSVVQQRLVSLQKEYGPEHSEVLKVSAQMADLQSKVSKRVQGIMASLEANVASLKQGLDKQTEAVTKAQQMDSDKVSESRPYFEAKAQLEELKRFRQALNVKILAEQTDDRLPKESVVEIITPAVEALYPSRPNKTLNIVLGVIIGLVVGVGLAFFIEYLDTSVKTIDDVERSLGSPVLGVIPQNVGILLEEGAESPHAEAYRVLRTNLLFSRKDDKLNSVAVVSAGAGEGKSTTVFNLATVFAQSGQRVVVVDSDLRRPTLHKIMHVDNNLGLTNYLLKQNTLAEVIQTSKLPTLDFVSSGKLPSSSLGILSSGQMKELIHELKQHYDFVFFDSPPVMGVSDASILASEVDMTLQVIQYRRYPQPMNIRAKQLIEKVGGNLAGIVLNNINMSQDESYYYYSGYYHEYYSRDEDQEPKAASKDGSGKKEQSKTLKM